MILLFALSQIFGSTFLCLKQTLYYMLFYFAGYAWSRMQGLPLFQKRPRLIAISGSISICLFLYLLVRYNLYSISDNFTGIVIRGSASLAGCVALCGMSTSWKVQGKFASTICWIGTRSLDIYLIHNLVLCCIRTETLSAPASISGFLLVILNFSLTVALSAVFSELINQNSIMRKVLFGKS